ncbi:MAG TPA: TadE/TadG family type IV pilus assembly protein [Dongiaceae bacterium]|jgi:Flp pilus assembly protein TadG|nr:TadE/TadG family type IV pilus assembly protein [Dongiaceae bacterium]
MIGWLAKRSRLFARDRRGAVAIEYALILPVLLMFSFGILEISLCMASLVTLEGGLKQASRFGITSQTPSDADVAAVADQVPTAFSGKDNRTKMIMAILNQNTLDLIDLNQATISTQTFDSFSAVGTGEPYADTNSNGQWDSGEPYSDTNCNGVRDGPGAASGGSGASGDTGVSGSIVVYTVNYNWQIITPIVGQFLGQPDPSRPGKYMIPMSAQMVVKNEPNVSGSSFCK